MSRGPGRVMRAALAELAEHGDVSAFGVAVRAAHDAACGCDDPLCRDETPRPSRAQLVSARRALHALARDGQAELHRISTWETPPVLAAKRCPAPQTCAVGNTYGPIAQRMLGIRETDRCDSCARLFAEVDFGGVAIGTGASRTTVRVQGLALCRDCGHGLTDPVALASGGEFSIDLMEPLPCADCGGELSERGLRRIYVDGATWPMCDACAEVHVREGLARHGYDLDAIKSRLGGGAA